MPFVNTNEATKKVERPNRERQMYKYYKRERRVGLSTLVNPFHTEHNPPDVIGLDNNTAMLLANSKTITDDFTPTLPYVSFGIFSPCTKIYSRAPLYNAAPSSPSRPRGGDSLAINCLNIDKTACDNCRKFNTIIFNKIDRLTTESVRAPISNTDYRQ